MLNVHNRPVSRPRLLGKLCVSFPVTFGRKKIVPTAVPLQTGPVDSLEQPGSQFLERDGAVDFFEFVFWLSSLPQAECHLIELHLIEGRHLFFKHTQ